MDTLKAVLRSDTARAVGSAAITVGKDFLASQDIIGKLRDPVARLQKPNEKYMVPARQIVKMYKPTWDIHRTERMASFILPAIQTPLQLPENYAKLVGGGVSTYKQALKSLADSEPIKKVFDMHESEFERMYGEAENVSTESSGKLTLAASKTQDLDGSSLLPTPREATESTVQADLFSYQPVNEGVIGGLAVDEARNHDVIRFRNPLYEPRPYDAMDLMNLPSDGVWQWNHELPMGALQQEAVQDFVIQQYLERYAPAMQTQRYGLNDVNEYVWDSQSEELRPDPNYFLPTNYREPMNIDMASALPLPYNNKPLRNVLEPYGYGDSEWGPSKLLAMDTKPNGLQNYLQNGFDPIY